MILIPVIDLLQGLAVHARQGLRDSYRALDSSLCRDGAVLPLVDTLVQDWGATHLYLADLDAIQGTGNHLALLQQIRSRFPQLTLWLDGGFRTPDDIRTLREQLSVRCVVGSESWISDQALPHDCVLSVDSDADGPRDPSGICCDSTRLPDELILMNLSRVGSAQGPDLALLQHWQQRTPQARLYAAGGVRDAEDLQRLRTAGAAGVLLASALHAGHLSPADLRA